MKRILSFAALAAASLTFACGTEAPVDEDGTLDESNDELTKREASYLGQYNAAPGSLDEIQSLTLNNDNSFEGQLGTNLTGSPIQCFKAPCTTGVSGHWTALKTWQGKILFKLHPEVGAAKEIAYYADEPAGRILTLHRSPNVTVTLTKHVICPLNMPMPPVCPSGQKLKSKQTPDGCFGGWSCEDFVCPIRLPAPLKCPAFEQAVPKKDANGCFAGYECVSCPQIEPNPPGQTCNGTWKSVYGQNGCFLGTKCEPAAPVCPQIEPNPPFVTCNAPGKTWSKAYNQDGCFLGTSCVDRAQDGCVVSGCNSEICAASAMNSICIADPKFDKFHEAGVLCEKTAGTCGWTFPKTP